jgi:hypothetical protein
VSLLTFTPRHNGPGFRMIVTDQDKKRLGAIVVTAGVPVFEPKGKLFLEAELLSIAEAMRRLGTRPMR